MFVNKHFQRLSSQTTAKATSVSPSFSFSCIFSSCLVVWVNDHRLILHPISSTSKLRATPVTLGRPSATSSRSWPSQKGIEVEGSARSCTGAHKGRFVYVGVFHVVSTSKCCRRRCRMKLIRHVSFVDCPGYDILVASMLDGASVMDAALLPTPSNETCPLPQTSDHVAAIEIMKLENILLLLQNKVV